MKGRIFRSLLNNRKLLEGVGFALSMIALLHVGLKLYSYRYQFDVESFSIGSSTIYLLLACCYMLISLLLAYSWRELMLAESQKLTFSSSLTLYGRSQLAKYVPGNIFHLASRQLMGKADGHSMTGLARSTVWEVALLSISSLGLAIFCIPGIGISVNFVIPLFLLFNLFVYVALRKFFPKKYIKAYFGYLSFHVLAGLIFLILADYVFHINTESILMFIGAYFLAWLLGFITPGAPGGLGVREVVMMGVLSSSYDEISVLLLLFYSRIITILGDLGFFMLSFFMVRQKQDEI